MDLNITLIGYINDGILSGKSKFTLKRYQEALTFFQGYLKTNFIPLKTESVTPELLEGFFLYGIKERKWSKYTHWTNYLRLSGYLNWMVKKGYISASPLVGIPKPKLPQRFPKSLKEEDVMELLRATTKLGYKYTFTQKRNKAIVATMLFSGIRKQELLNLKVEDVDLKSGFIFVKDGKGGKSREIPIESSILHPILIEYNDYRKSLNRYENYFFTGQWVGEKKENSMGRSGIDRLFRLLSVKMKMRIHPHGLRHTFATLLLDRTDGDIYTTQILMGHSDIKTTTIYLNSTVRRKVAAIKTLNLMSESKNS